MRRAPALHTHGKVSGVSGVRILKVLTAEEMAKAVWPEQDCLVLHDGDSGKTLLMGDVSVAMLRDPDVINAGAVIRLREHSSQISVLYRRGSLANTLFVTERCNSLCLMCSQPPRDEDDSWRIAELLQTVALVDRDELQLGFTGGEPTLLETDFANVLAVTRQSLPDTHLHVLTNGRKFADDALARKLVEAGGSATTWAVPLYADVASIHDKIVAAPGAFKETLSGLCNLAMLGARVEIRVVLHALSVPRLGPLASFIYRRMPFVEHVALMGLEPMGLARSNRDQLWIDPADYTGVLAEATHHMAVRGLTVSIYNLPLCVLPRDLWPFARQSISDWKNIVDDPACLQCALSHRCAGFFLSADKTWRSRAIRPFVHQEPNHEMA